MTKEERNALLYKPQNGLDRISAVEEAEMNDYCEQYKAFLDVSKTERECVVSAIRLAEAKGFKPYTPGMAVAPGDKLYYNNRGKAIMLMIIGQKPLSEGANIGAAHTDSPRLDLKPNPLYEDAELAYLKTHHYGGIRKYQWVTVPLELHGLVVRRDGSEVYVKIGDDPKDPQLVINDLLPHLGREQGKKPLNEAIPSETLNILVGSRPLRDDDGSDRVKVEVLRLLNEKYGITEEDFISAELEAVPAANARDIGLDRSLIGAYGHDDRVCAFAELAALLALDKPEKTAVCIFADKEEIGSEGVSGMQGDYFEYVMASLCHAQGVGVVGTLQFDVFQYRMKSEYGVDLRMEGLPYEQLRFITAAPVADLKDLNLSSDAELLEDYRGRSLLVFASQWSINYILKRNPGLELSETAAN